MNNVSIKNFLHSFQRTDINRSETCKRIPLKYINVMFKNFVYFASSISFIHSKRFDPNVFGMNLDVDGDIITAESRNPFKSKYCYWITVDVKRKYFTIVRIVHYKNNMCYNDYIAERLTNSN